MFIKGKFFWVWNGLVQFKLFPMGNFKLKSRTIGKSNALRNGLCSTSEGPLYSSFVFIFLVQCFLLISCCCFFFFVVVISWFSYYLPISSFYAEPLMECEFCSFLYFYANDKESWNLMYLLEGRL